MTTRTARRRMAVLTPPQEWQEQAALLTWAQLHEGREPRLRLLFHIANGEHRSKRTAAKLQAMGVKAGVPDLFLPVPMRHTQAYHGQRAHWHGCFLEMKRAGAPATLTPEQGTWYAQLSLLGYAVHTAQGWVDAARYLCWYLQRNDLHATLTGDP